MEKTYPEDWKWESPYSVKETMDRLLAIIDKHPEVLQYGRVDQQAVACLSGKEIKDVEVVFFQNSQLVGEILSANIEAAAALPIKTTVWEDANGQVWIQATHIDEMNARFKLNGANGAVESIRKLLPAWIGEAMNK